jgi:DNA (cytosine-5)-methyltransferase 1
MGFDAEWGVLGAADVGANHKRDRIWIVAHSNSVNKWPIKNWIDQSEGNSEWKCPSNSGNLENTNGKRQQEQRKRQPKKQAITKSKCTSWWAAEPNVGRMAHGVAYRVDRLKAIGNGQVSEVARTAWEILNGQD